MFEEFMSIIREAEQEKGITFEDFTEGDFFDVEENLDRAMFSDPQVQEKLRGCACVESVIVDEEQGMVIIRLIDGCIGEFPIAKH